MIRGGFISAICFCLVASGFPVSAEAVEARGVPESLEFAVKATFLYKLAGFVEWPGTAFEAPTSPVTICVLGNDPVASLIDQAAAGQKVADRAIAVRHLQTVNGIANCQILYIAAGSSTAEAQAATHGMPVLIVTDSRKGSGEHAIVTFVVQDNRVRFDIDDAAAA